ncbi:hypothetical protein PG993_001092 [Apiospora rasikravindrae]|uniref:Uncharacterized protein n=1 Tax=Apiospora rasikravindrae TaxID=990691 RepID=A0ABR1UCN5_9PEZI
MYRLDMLLMFSQDTPLMLGQELPPLWAMYRLDIALMLEHGFPPAQVCLLVTVCLSVLLHLLLPLRLPALSIATILPTITSPFVADVLRLLVLPHLPPPLRLLALSTATIPPTTTSPSVVEVVRLPVLVYLGQLACQSNKGWQPNCNLSQNAGLAICGGKSTSQASPVGSSSSGSCGNVNPCSSIGTGPGTVPGAGPGGPVNSLTGPNGICINCDYPSNRGQWACQKGYKSWQPNCKMDQHKNLAACGGSCPSTPTPVLIPATFTSVSPASTPAVPSKPAYTAPVHVDCSNAVNFVMAECACTIPMYSTLARCQASTSTITPPETTPATSDSSPETATSQASNATPTPEAPQSTPETVAAATAPVTTEASSPAATTPASSPGQSYGNSNSNDYSYGYE